jgi:hypothetical protein
VVRRSCASGPDGCRCRGAPPTASPPPAGRTRPAASGRTPLGPTPFPAPGSAPGAGAARGARAPRTRGHRPCPRPARAGVCGGGPNAPGGWATAVLQQTAVRIRLTGRPGWLDRRLRQADRGSPQPTPPLHPGASPPRPAACGTGAVRRACRRAARPATTTVRRGAVCSRRGSVPWGLARCAMPPRESGPCPAAHVMR